MFISTKLKKIKRFYLFIYIFVFICTRWKIFTNTYSPKSIKWSILLPESWNFLREKLETVNKFISKKLESFVMVLYLRNGNYVSNFIDWLFLFDFSRSETYSNNNIFLFYSFFAQTVKSLRKTLSLREIENVVWKWKNIAQKYPLVLKGRCCWDEYYVQKVEYWLWISKAHWNFDCESLP